MAFTKEKQIIFTIRYAPLLFIIFVATFITIFIYNENKKEFIAQKKDLEQNYFIENKKLIKEEIDRVNIYLKFMKTKTEDKLKKEIKNRVYEAHALATNLCNNYKNKMSDEELFELIKNALNDIRFNNQRGYFFIDDVHGNKLLYPIDKSIEGKNFYDYEDVKGYKLFQTIVQTIKDKTERYDEYYWHKPNSKDISKKISFYKYFEPLNLAIGTGEYVEDFEKEVQISALEYISKIRLDKYGYIFVLDKNLNILSHIDEKLLNKNVKEIDKLDDFKKIAFSIVSNSLNSGYYSYIEDRFKNSKKTSYIEIFQDWDWIIGTGFYDDELLNKIELKKDELSAIYDTYIVNFMIVTFILTFILLAISFYISQILENKFMEYEQDINKKQSILHQQSKMAAMGEMIGNIAHQWRQPLSTITTSASGISLQKQMGFLTDEQFYESMKNINASAQHLSKTIDDFRNFFSPDKIKSNFLLKNTFSTTLDLVSAQFHNKDIKIIRHIENIEIFSYENELIQSLINILNNAKDELIKLPEDVERLIFIDAFKNDKDNIEITISDSAGGVPDDIINKIFEPYFTTKHKSQGTGIGLYMTEEIISKHLGGKISVQNKSYIYKDKAYKGAEFKIVLKQKNIKPQA